MDLSPEVIERIKLLEEKYSAMGQDSKSYLEGLLHTDYLTYWNYIHLDTLLTLQSPRTSFPDEMVFIVYHQITELYFRLCLHELEQVANASTDAVFMTERLWRMNSYFEGLTHSFGIMVDGMEKDQFLKFRMALLPASGFQSGQYRMIEICSTDFINLVDRNERHRFISGKGSIKEMFEFLYWKQGATELATGRKTLTLKQFEEKYSPHLIALGEACKNKNLLTKYNALPENERHSEALIKAMRQWDINVNINWPLVHYKSAVRYLHRSPDDIAATGGTNWQKYLPPRFQKRIFFPALWTEKEKEEWGKTR